jgi:hypothetical protein
VHQVDAIQHLGAARPGKGLAHAEQLLVLSHLDSATAFHRVTDHHCFTHHLLIDPFQFRNKLVVELEAVGLAVYLWPKAMVIKKGYESEGRTILKCTGGPPNEVKPKYHVSLTVFQSRGPGFQSRAQVLGDQPGLTPMVDFRLS